MHLDLNLQSVIFAHVLTCLALAASVGWVARGDNRDGLRTWAFAICIYSIGFALVGLRGIIPDIYSVILGNFLISLFYSMFWLAIKNFFAKPIKKLLFWLPPVSIVCLYLFLMDTLRARIFVGNSILLIQSLLICAALLEGRRLFPSRGRDLILVIMLLAPPLLLIRIVMSIIKPAEVEPIFTASWVQVVSGTIAYVATILVSNGFVLMAKERSDERLRMVAMKDRLTGCWNRVRIDEFANQEMARLTRHGQPASLIMIDVDHFKHINDRFGHAVGDAVLVELAGIVQRGIRPTDLLGRWGGEEFVVILSFSGLGEAVAIAERIRQSVEEHCFPDGLRVTTSLGLSTCFPTDTWQSWMSRADRALYRAKHYGRNLVQVE